MRSTAHLRVVRDESAPPPETRRANPGRAVPDRGGFALLAFLFLLNAIPVTGELARIGRWSPGIVGFAAGAMLLIGHALWSEIGARARARQPG
jgi:hypothetical protein